MRRILILVEGQTEERFVKDVLQPFLWETEVHIEPKDCNNQASETRSRF